MTNNSLSKQNVNLLAISGGGLRGIMSLRILDTIEKYIQNIIANDHSLLSKFNLYTAADFKLSMVFDILGGTSAGSIIASQMALANETISNVNGTQVITYDQASPKYYMQDILNKYNATADAITATNTAYSIKTCWGWCGPKYQSSNLEHYMMKLFGDVGTKDTARNVLITGYDITKPEPVIWSSFDENNVKLYQATTASSSYVPYFAPYSMIDGISNVTHKYIDGGYHSETTVLEVLEKALESGVINPSVTKNINIVFIGTGRVKITDQSLGNYGPLDVMQNIEPLYCSTDKQQEILFTTILSHKSLEDPLLIGINMFAFDMDIDPSVGTFPSVEIRGELDKATIAFMANGTEAYTSMQQFVEDVLYIHPFDE